MTGLLPKDIVIAVSAEKYGQTQTEALAMKAALIVELWSYQETFKKASVKSAQDLNANFAGKYLRTKNSQMIFVNIVTKKRRKDAND